MRYPIHGLHPRGLLRHASSIMTRRVTGHGLWAHAEAWRHAASESRRREAFSSGHVEELVEAAPTSSMNVAGSRMEQQAVMQKDLTRAAGEPKCEIHNGSHAQATSRSPPAILPPRPFPRSHPPLLLLESVHPSSYTSLMQRPTRDPRTITSLASKAAPPSRSSSALNTST